MTQQASVHFSAVCFTTALVSLQLQLGSHHSSAARVSPTETNLVALGWPFPKLPTACTASHSLGGPALWAPNYTGQQVLRIGQLVYMQRSSSQIV